MLEVAIWLSESWNGFIIACAIYYATDKICEAIRDAGRNK